MFIKDATQIKLPDLEPEQSLEQIEKTLARKIGSLCPTPQEGRWHPIPWHHGRVCTRVNCSEPHDDAPDDKPIAFSRPNQNTLILAKKENPISGGGFSAVHKVNATCLERSRFLPGRYRKRPFQRSYVLFTERTNRDFGKLYQTLLHQQKAYEIKGASGHIAPPPSYIENIGFIQPHLGDDFLDIVHKQSIPSDQGESIPLTTELKVEMLLQALQAVMECHEAGVFHLDIKMENFTAKFDEKGCLRVHLIDFGEAIAEEEAKDKRRLCTREFFDTCTQNGMPPTAATDIYAVGCLVGEMLPLAYDQHYCRGYLNDGVNHFCRQVGLLTARWKKFYFPDASEQDIIERCLSIVCQTIEADQKLFEFSLNNGLRLGIFFDKKSVDFTLNNPDLYEKACWHAWNLRRKHAEKPSEPISEADLHPMRFFDIHVREGEPSAQPISYDDYAQQAETLYPSLIYLYSLLENALIRYKEQL